MKRTLAFALFLATFVSLVFAEKNCVAQVLQDNQRGSFLVIPKFDIRGTASTQIRVTNYNHEYDIGVKLNYVCPGVKFVNDRCAALDTRFELTPNQTRVIDVIDQNPPCNQGFIVAYAVGSTEDDVPSNNNVPVSWDYLGGSYHVSDGRRLESENAIALQSPASDLTVLGSGTPRQLRIGSDYSALGTKLFTDFRSINNAEPAAGSRLVLLTLDTLAGTQNPASLVFVDFWNAAEVPYSSSLEFICWTERQLDSIDLNFLEENLGTTYGSMELTPVGNCPIPGTCPPNPLWDPTILGHIEEYGDGVRGGRTLLHDDVAKSTVYQPR
jgi:hypothetical protein